MTADASNPTDVGNVISILKQEYSDKELDALCGFAEKFKNNFDETYKSLTSFPHLFQRYCEFQARIIGIQKLTIQWQFLSINDLVQKLFELQDKVRRSYQGPQIQIPTSFSHEVPLAQYSAELQVQYSEITNEFLSGHEEGFRKAIDLQVDIKSYLKYQTELFAYQAEIVSGQATYSKQLTRQISEINTQLEKLNTCNAALGFQRFSGASYQRHITAMRTNAVSSTDASSSPWFHMRGKHSRPH